MADEAPVLQYINHDSIVHRMDGLSKLLWLLVVAVGMLTFKTLLPGAIILALLFVVALIGARIPIMKIVKSAPILFGVGFLLGIFHSVIHPGNPLLTIGPLTVTDTGLQTGASYFLRISVVVFASYLLIWTTNIRDLMAGLVHVGIPYQYAFGVFTALRFLPVIQREVDAVSSAHAIRGQVQQSQLGQRFQLWRRYVFTIMVNGLRKAEFAATAAQLRGIGIKGTRTSYKPFHWSPTGVGMVMFFLALIVALHVVA